MKLPKLHLEAPELADLRWRWLLAGGGVFYPLWYLHSASLTGMQDPLWMRVSLGAACFGLLGARVAGMIGVTWLVRLASALTWLITTHYFWVLTKNRLHPEHVMAALVVVYGGATCFISMHALLAYAAYAIGLAGISCLTVVDPLSRPVYFFACLTTMLVFAFIAADGKLRILRSLREKGRVIEDQQREIVQSARMSAVGTLAKGVAHEINNPLAVIGLKAERLADLAVGAPPALHSEIVETSDKIVATVMRIARVVSILRTIGHPYDAEPVGDVPLASLAASAADMYRERARDRGIEISVRDASHGAAVPCRPGQVSQVLLHLLENAMESILRGPTSGAGPQWVRIEADVVHGDGVIAVVDSGPGIPANVRDRIFDAFFTTKPVGQGMGIGLSYATRIAGAHGGEVRLDVSSANTRFVLRLPDARTHPRRRDLRAA